VNLSRLEPAAGVVVRGIVYASVTVVICGAWLKGAWLHAKDALL
jgi:hypothetical protein